MRSDAFGEFRIGCWASPSIGRVAGFGCDDVGLNGCGFEVHVVLGEELLFARMNMRDWAGLMRAYLWLRLLMMKMVCRLSKDLAVTSCARKM